jgi:predicted DNA-binding transcriptional regulator AlpA
MWTTMYRSVSSTVVTVCAFNPSCFLRNVSMSTSITSSPGLSTTAALKELDGSGIQVAQSALQLLYLKSFNFNCTFGIRTLEEVVLNLKRAEGHAHLTLRWRGGAITTLDVSVPRFRPQGLRTDEDIISLLRRLAVLYPDEVIAGIFNRQGRKTATGERFSANQVGSLRRYRNIPRFQPSAEAPDGELVTIRKAAQILGMNTSSIHRWLADGFIAGEQVTPGAPWQIRINAELQARIVQQASPEYLPMLEATMKLGVSRQTVLQRVKRGELQAVLVRQGRRKGLRIKVVDQQSQLFEQISRIRGQYEAVSKNPRMSASSTQFTRFRWSPTLSASSA